MAQGAICSIRASHRISVRGYNESHQIHIHLIDRFQLAFYYIHTLAKLLAGNIAVVLVAAITHSYRFVCTYLALRINALPAVGRNLHLLIRQFVLRLH